MRIIGHIAPVCGQGFMGGGATLKGISEEYNNRDISQCTGRARSLSMVIQLVVAALSGGLAGGCVSTLFNRIFHWRILRTQFYPKVNDLLGEYVIRMQDPEGRYLMVKVGYDPLPADKAFVEHRVDFIMNLVTFNELKEARELRRKLLEQQAKEPGEKGDEQKIDLMRDYQALSDCLDKMHKKLKLS